MKKITILGTGAMGSRVALNYIKANYEVSIYNRTKDNAKELIKKGAKYFSAVKDAVKDAEIIISFLKDDKVVEEIWFNQDCIDVVKPNAIVIESSTLSSSCITKLYSSFKNKKIDFLVAPVLGSRPQAQNASLIFLVSGEEIILNKVKNILDITSSKSLYLGHFSNGCKYKLAINAYFAAQVSLLAELTALLEKANIKKDDFFETFSQLPTTAPALAGITSLMSQNNFEPLFPIDLVTKDLNYCLDMGKELNVDLPLVSKTKQTYQNAIENGFGKDNITGILQVYVD